MSEPNESRDIVFRDEEISLFTLGTILLRHRWRIARWALIGALIAAASVITKPALYRASASFIPQGYDSNRSTGLASVAGQLGVSLPTGNASQSPEFYARLLRSRVVLEPVVRDTFTVEEQGRKRITFLDLFGVTGETPKRRQEKGISMLQRIVTPSVAKTTGTVDVSVATQWPSVSLAIVTTLVDAVNDFNQRTRQEQAALERKFVEGRLAVASADLRDAEDRQEQFLKMNRSIGGSPELTAARERMQRDVGMKQQVFTTLSQAYEDVRIREVRNTPVITVLEPPFVPTLPEPRGRIKSVLFGFIAGGFIGVLLAFSTEMLARRRREGSVEANEFVGVVEEIKAEARKSVRRLRRRRSGR